MSHSFKDPGLALVVLCVVFLCAITNVQAQTACTILDNPPTGVAPAGDVLRAGHLGRQVADLQPIIHFYHDLIGLELSGTRGQPRPFFTNQGLQDVASLAQGVPNPEDQVSRAALLPIPGTAAEQGGPEMTIEAIEIKGIPSKPYQPALTDPGASYLKLIVSDLDETLTLLKGERFPVITVGGSPVTNLSWPGVTGKIRSVFVRDPDGYPVELVEISPRPSTTAPPGSRVLGASVSIVVDDLEETCDMYQSIVPELKFWLSPSLMGDEAYESLTGTRGQFRLGQAMVPGSPVILELIEYQNTSKNYLRPNFQDPGAAHFLFMARDADVMIDRVKGADLHTTSPSNAPVFIAPTTRMFFVTDPQGFWIEFMDHGVKEDPVNNGSKLNFDPFDL